MTPDAKPVWGRFVVGDYVTNRGRTGAGQPAVSGTAVEINRDLVVIETRDGRRVRRSIRNVRRYG